MENERCKITLNNETNTYYSGETITGTITLNSNKPRKIRGIYFKLIGYGKCSWSDMLTKVDTSNSLHPQQPHPKADHSATFTAQEEYVSIQCYVIGSKIGAAFEIPKGLYSNVFRYQLKPYLPSSFKGYFGKVKYVLTFTVERPWIFDENYQVPLTIIQSYNLHQNPLSSQPFHQQLTRTIGFLKTGPLTMNVDLIKSGYCYGENAIVKIHVMNYSPVNVEKIKVILYQIVRYNSRTPMRSTKDETIKLIKKDIIGGVDKKTEYSTDCIIEIPNIQTTDNNYHQIINISYEIKVEAKINIHKNLLLKIPIIIGSRPITTHPPPSNHQQRPSLSNLIPPQSQQQTNDYGFLLAHEMMAPQQPPTNTTSHRHLLAHEMIEPQQPYFIDNSRTDIESLMIRQPPMAPSAPPQAPPDFDSYPLNSTSRIIGHSNGGSGGEVAPPSYNEIFGSPSHFSNSSYASSHMNSMSSSFNNISLNTNDTASNCSSIRQQHHSLIIDGGVPSPTSSSSIERGPPQACTTDAIQQQSQNSSRSIFYKSLDEQKININEID